MKLGKLATAAAFAALVTAPILGQSVTKKFDYHPMNGVQDVDIKNGDVVVGQLVFDQGSTLKGTPIRKSSADVRVRIDNNGVTDQQVGVAVVVFDAEGNVVGAGSNGTKWGYLNKGDRTYYDIDFPYVYRRLDQAASFIVTIETQPKGTKATATTASATSATTNGNGHETQTTTETRTTTTETRTQPTVESEPLPPQR